MGAKRFAQGSRKSTALMEDTVTTCSFYVLSHEGHASLTDWKKFEYLQFEIFWIYGVSRQIQILEQLKFKIPNALNPPKQIKSNQDSDIC